MALLSYLSQEEAKGAVMENELKPCPFCGGDNIMDEPDDEKTYVVYCNTCFVCVEGYNTKEKAFEVWNTRHTPKVSEDLKMIYTDLINLEAKIAGKTYMSIDALFIDIDDIAKRCKQALDKGELND